MGNVESQDGGNHQHDRHHGHGHDSRKRRSTATRRRSHSSSTMQSRGMTQHRSMVTRLLRHNSSDHVMRKEEGKKVKRGSVEQFIAGMQSVSSKPTTVEAAIKANARSSVRMKPMETKSQIELESVILARFDEEGDGYLTRSQINRASKVLFRRNEQPTESEIDDILSAAGTNRKIGGIKIKHFVDIWVRVVKKQEDLSQQCTNIAFELRDLETTLQEVVLTAIDRDELLLIQQAFLFFQKAEQEGETSHVSYLSMKKELFKIFGKDFVNERKNLLARFLQSVTAIERKRTQFRDVEMASAWKLVAEEIEKQKQVGNAGKEIFNGSQSPTSRAKRRSAS